MAPLIPDTTSAPAVVAISTMAEPKVALSMDTLDLIDATMFPTLPEALQQALSTLTRLELKKLGTALGVSSVNVLLSKKEIMFDFVLWDKYHREEKSLKGDDVLQSSSWEMKIWLRVHLAEAVKQMRAELDLALGKNIVILTSNVESNIVGIDATRQSASDVRFHHHKSGQKGVLTWEIMRIQGYPYPFYVDDMEVKLDEDSK
ncbi:hypothetical protein E6O75_ATG04664 [Venturia nashicola]|uniref:Uncharacterized protein n=1 Tax=Venturia nashicola TaxID=86259 RepID=A0A4Z1PHF7_9PEZI|nr:hypothetical protein E6O75_ATG04664 [Venturia nashicola]